MGTMSAMTRLTLSSAAAVADALDLLVPPADRRRSTAWVLLCDDHDELVVPCVVDELPEQPPADECAALLAPFAAALGAGSGAGLLLALTRRGQAAVTDLERRWFHAAHAVCVARAVRLLGVHLLTPEGAREVHLDDAA